MPKINIPGSGHAGPAPNSGFQWTAFGPKNKKILDQAMFIIRTRIKGYKPCNKAFEALSGGRSFDDIWNDNSIWISYDPQTTAGTFGATLGNDITLTAYTMAIGRWTVAATLVHELAHVDGAPGNTAEAESTLISCLLAGLRDPTIIGAIENGGTTRLA